MKPIIDIRAHIFSSMDIPVEEYLLSRSYVGQACPGELLDKMDLN